MSDPTMPAGLAAILAEPGWEHEWEDVSEDIGRQCCCSFAVSDFLTVRYVWFQFAGRAPVFDGVPEALPTGGWALGRWEMERAADLMRRIEQAIAPRAALAQEGTIQ